MKKRLLPLALALCMTLSLLPATAAAAELGNFSDTNVAWLGTQLEYRQTLDGMFPNGLRKIKAGDKWGIVDPTGAFVAPPIYDSILLKYGKSSRQDEGDAATQHLFMDGYAQCVRGGKYGLLNQYGEEVIPAQYAYVALPSEGVSRVYASSGGKNHLGYWNLEQGREIVPPGKYMYHGKPETADLPCNRPDMASSGFGIPGSPEHTRTKGAVRGAASYDFQNGYAFVPTGDSADGPLGTIIDKNGKEILPGGPYLVQATGTRELEQYPQYGPYLAVMQKSQSRYSADIATPYWRSGVVGPQGAILPTEYSGGQILTSGVAQNRNPVGEADPVIIPKHSLVVITKDTTPGTYLGGRRGVVNFKNQVVLPFAFSALTYDRDYDLLIGDRSFDNTGNDVALYNVQGKKIGKNYSSFRGSITNGYLRAATYTAKNGGGDFSYGFLNVKTGQDCFLLPTSNPDFDKYEYSDFSTGGLVWQKTPQNKWGLMNAAGKEILPHQYDQVDAAAWTHPKNGYAIVNIGEQQGLVSATGQVLLPCEYSSFDNRATAGLIDPEYIIAKNASGTGLFSVATGKFAIPCAYTGIGGANARQYQASYFRLGVNVVKTAQGYALVNKSGNLIPGSQSKVLNEPNDGLFFTGTAQTDYLGPDGKVVLPAKLSHSGRKNFVTDDTTLVVKDGKVGYIAADRLAKPTTAKAPSPATATATPSPTKLLVNGKAVAASAYLIGQNNYVKLRDLAYLVNGTGKNFEVKWDDGKKAIDLKSNTKYTPVAGDMTPAAGGAQTAARSSSTVYVDGLGRNLTAYTINGNNYFKLRDVMRVFDIAVGYDNATATATLDTSQGYTRTDGEKAGITAAPTDGVPPPAAQVRKLEITKAPKLEFYLKGDHTFSTAGFQLRYWDEKGQSHAITDVSQMEFKVEGDVIGNGYVFQTSSMKTGTVGYQGLTAPIRFPVYAGAPKGEADPKTIQLADGKYTLSVLGNTVGVTFMGKMILDSKNPTIVCVKRVEDYYYLSWDSGKGTEYYSPSPEGGQLFAFGRIESSSEKWKITSLGGDTYSIRQYMSPSMVVCTAAAAKKDGTAVMVWKNTKTPTHATFTFTPVK